jgi:tetratricopeptide (TPR) repeat protein
MLYKLIGGHPPFYPDVTPERVRTETPPPLAGRPTAPPQLADLVARCLAKDAALRPKDMAELARELRACLDLPVAEEPAANLGPRLTPPVDAAPIRPGWQRSVASGPSARELRGEGFRRGLLVSGAVLSLAAVVFVFFLLPGLMQRQVPAAVPTVAPAATTQVTPAKDALPTDAQSLEQLAEQKRQGDEMRGPLDQRLAALEKKDVTTWGGASLGEARAALAAADAASGHRDFAAALASLRTAAQRVEALEKQVPVVLRQRVADGNAALDTGRTSDAQREFSAALRIEPSHAAATLGMKRAQVLDEVLRETATGSRAEQAGDATAALAAYQRALKLDPATRAAREGIARLQARATGDAFAAAMSQGLGALARKDYVAARGAFERAGRIRPGAPEVADGLQQIEQAGRTRDINAILARARAAEREERWADALNAYRDALKGDPALIEGQQGADRSEPRAMVDAQLQTYIERPDRLFSPDGRAAARNALAQAQAVPSPGPRLSGQVQRLTLLVQQAETPIRVAFTSDNITAVQIYRVGKLGNFEHRDMELMPGRYTVVGSRQGFRDVRKEFSLLPGAPPTEVVIRCEEPI